MAETTVTIGDKEVQIRETDDGFEAVEKPPGRTRSREGEYPFDVGNNTTRDCGLPTWEEVYEVADVLEDCTDRSWKVDRVVRGNGCICVHLGGILMPDTMQALLDAGYITSAVSDESKVYLHPVGEDGGIGDF